MTNDIPEGLLAFDIEKALAGWPCVTRNGQEVRIGFVSDLKDNKEYPLRGWFNKGSTWDSYSWDIQGFANEDKDPCPWQLFLKKKTKTYWHNIYKDEHGDFYVGGKACKTEQEAKNAGGSLDSYLKTTSFELDDVEAEPAKPKTKKLWIAIRKNGYAGTYTTSDARQSLEELNKLFDQNDDFWIKEIEVERDD